MTESERAQVVAALEIGRRYVLTMPEHLASVAAALAIMRREDRATQAGDISAFGHPVCQDYRPQKV